MKKWSLVPQFKGLKKNCVTIAFGNYISERKKNHKAQTYQSLVAENKNLDSELCIYSNLGEEKKLLLFLITVRDNFDDIHKVW